MKKIQNSALPELFAAIASKADLYLPVKSGEGARFEKWSPDAEIALGEQTGRSAKDFFFPQVETIASFRTEGKAIEIIDERKECADFVLFGVRACDERSFAILDRVFLADPVDTFYQNRRAHGTIVTLACTEPEETCFCHTFGIDAANPGGDATLYPTGDGYALCANTEKGKALIASLSDLPEDGDDAEAARLQNKMRETISRLPLQNLPTDYFQPEKMMEHFADPKWKELSAACLGCGTCTFVCPTCQCFDVRDIKTKSGAVRYRCWDSCMYSDFTQMAAAQPRLTQMERFRQRFMHKLVYFPANNDGVFGCVGCGRCLKSCPISMNIVKVMKKMGGDNQ